MADMKLIMEGWRLFAEESEDEDRLFNEVGDICLSFRAGALITEDASQKQFLVQLEKLYTLYEQGEMSRRGFLKNLMKGGAALAAAAAVPSLAHAAGPAFEEPAEHTHDVESEDWMRFGKATSISTKGDRFSLYHNGTDRSGDDATIVFLKGFDGPTRDYLFNGQGEVIGFAQKLGVDAKKMPLWKPHFHPPKSGYPAEVSSGVEFNLDSHINNKLYELPAPVKE
tara:strand:- start:86 stop:760 length:675 start_codon:yes stop_codon:yes gene_type:complete